MSFKFAIIGLPNVGKSTLFNALTKLNVKAKNFPFCTINPNIGIVKIPDSRINQLKKIVNPKKIVQSTMKFIDVAGLVKGASKGEGLGNKFLKNIAEADVIGHVVRCFQNENIIHITGKINPKNDIDTINTELLLYDLEKCENSILSIKKSNVIDDKIKLKLLILKKCLLHLNNGKNLRTLNLSNNERIFIKYINFLTIKPIIYIANINENSLNNDFYLNQIKNITDIENSNLIKINFFPKIKIKKKQEKLNSIIHTGYKILNLKTFFTVGVKEIRAWTIFNNTTTLKASGKIHTDFKKGFIRAKIISFFDFIKYKGEFGSKEAGKVRFEGKKYLIKDGDIIHFLFNI